MTQEKEEVFYKKNVPYRLGVRSDIKDHEGTVLDDENPYIAVHKTELRKFIQANKIALTKGALIEVEEPPMDIVTPNSITDDQAIELVKNYHALKKRLPEITSEVTVLKLLGAAKAGKKSDNLIKLITDRLEEVSPGVMVAVQ